MTLPRFLAAIALASATGCVAASAGVEDLGPAPVSGAPVIHDQIKAAMLRENTGLTLQWIGWEERGNARIIVSESGTWHLVASQSEPQQSALLQLDGEVTEIGSDYFLFDGSITIVNTPDAGRFCQQDKLWRFAITQDRQYWRLREFEWCDGLTDYIDIYF